MRFGHIMKETKKCLNLSNKSRIQFITSTIGGTKNRGGSKFKIFNYEGTMR